MSATHTELAVRWRRLLDLDADLAEALRDAAPGARDRVGAAAVMLEPGAWDPQTVRPYASEAFALVVCAGLIVRELSLAGTVTADLLGPGDLMALDTPRQPLVAMGDRWHVSGPTTIAILDERVLRALQAWPEITQRLIARAARQAARGVEHRAISQLPRVELRIRALLWHLAERWGRMGSSGVIVPLDLTHEAIGRLLGARRSTVTLAMGELAREGAVTRRDDGAWVLRVVSNPALIATSGATGCAVQRRRHLLCDTRPGYRI